MDPVNFQFADPGQAILGGLKLGALQDQVVAQRQEQAMKLQQQQLAMQQAQQQRADLAAMMSKPEVSHQDIAAYMMKYPSLAKETGEAWKVMDEGQRQNVLNVLSRIDSAGASGNLDLMTRLARERTDAGDKDMKLISSLLESGDPASINSAKLMVSSMVAGAQGLDKYAANLSTMGKERRDQQLQPSVLKKAEGDAAQSAAEGVIKGEQAKLAPQTALLDLQKKGWDIKKIQEDIAIAREDNRIKAMNAAISREGNDLKRQELRLKIQETQQKMDDAVREKVAKAESGATSIDNMLNTIERLKNNPRLNDVVGAIEGRLPSMGNDDSADAIALIETLGSQAFLAQLPNMAKMGALSEKEGDKLQASLQNLSRVQSEAQFRKNLDEASRLAKKMREGLSKSMGVPLPKPDTPAAPGARPPLSSFQK